MPASLVAVARTPWAPRHTALDGSRPEHLLAAALDALVARASIDPAEIDRVLVACDTSVGAQDLDLGRRAVAELGWSSTPALTVDGHGVTGLALVALAAELPGRTVVAGVDASSMVPPGAGLVRDYGRPTLDEPEHRWLDAVAGTRGLDPAALDAAAERARQAPPVSNPAIVDLAPGVDTVADVDPAEPFSPDGVVAPHHLAPWADGAVAVLIGHDGGRPLDAASFDAMESDEAIDRLIAPSAATHLLVADHTAVVAALAGADSGVVASTLAIGSTPSCDGLRMLADAAAILDGGFEVRTRGGHGQIASVVVGDGALVDATKTDSPT